MFDLLEKCAKTESHTTRLAHVITELRQKIMSIDARMTEMTARMTKLEQGRNNPTSQSASLAQSSADIVGITSFQQT